MRLGTYVAVLAIKDCLEADSKDLYTFSFAVILMENVLSPFRNVKCKLT